jgi:prolyl-tRNA synthetase
LGLTYLNEKNETVPVVMGCYGIGTARCMAAVVEQHNDENGIIWPASIAPFTVSIVVINVKDEMQMDVANNLYKKLSDINIDVILDDRDERPGVKFKDMDLIGIPYKITIGKKVNDGIVEFKSRDGKINTEIKVDDVLEKIKKI